MVDLTVDTPRATRYKDVEQASHSPSNVPTSSKRPHNNSGFDTLDGDDDEAELPDDPIKEITHSRIRKQSQSKKPRTNGNKRTKRKAVSDREIYALLKKD